MAPTKKPKAIGITCGIGSMLEAARQAGFDVIGNIEWRDYYRKRDPSGKNTFETNFGRPIYKSVQEMTQDQLNPFMNADIAFGHPECGHFSALNFSNPVYKEHQQDAGDIPLFIDLVAMLKPRFFVMDDLPRSFIAFPMEEYVKRLPEYDLWPEWVSNYHYGNVQLNRKRMFMIGALKKEKWAFVPGEFNHNQTIESVIGDLFGKEGKGIPNHEKHVLKDPCGKIADYYEYGYRGTWEDFQKAMKEREEGPPIKYISSDGTEKVRCGTAKVRWKGHGFVLDGGSVCTHPKRNLPLTIRERARIQGFPDTFVFYGTKLTPKGEWNHDKNNELVKQTGKAMPLQFNRFVAEQALASIQKKPFKASNERMLPANEFVDQAKAWFCENVGYANQKACCEACWRRSYCTLPAFCLERQAVLAAPKAARAPRIPSERTPRIPFGLTTKIVPGTIFDTVLTLETKK